jgi:hypothetical protein
MDQEINVTISELETLHVAIAEDQPINVHISAEGAAGPMGPTGPIDPNSHTHADPLAVSRIMTYVPEFKAYEIVE